MTNNKKIVVIGEGFKIVDGIRRALTDTERTKILHVSRQLTHEAVQKESTLREIEDMIRDAVFIPENVLKHLGRNLSTADELKLRKFYRDNK